MRDGKNEYIYLLSSLWYCVCYLHKLRGYTNHLHTLLVHTTQQTNKHTHTHTHTWNHDCAHTSPMKKTEHSVISIQYHGNGVLSQGMKGTRYSDVTSRIHSDVVADKLEHCPLLHLTPSA